MTPITHTTASLTLALLPLLATCGAPETPSNTGATPNAADPVPVEVATVTETSAETDVVATGRYATRDEIPLAFKTGGVVARLLVDEGDRVRRGQPLAALDLREIDALVAKAQAAVDKAQRDRDRVARLAADSVATRAQLQDAETGLAAARADLAQAQVNREYSVITAPEAGVVQQRLLVAGAMAAPGAPVLVLGGSRRGTVLRAGVADRDVVRLRVGDAAQAIFSALPGERFAGRVTLVGEAADPRSGTYAVEVALAAAAGVPLGMVGEVRISPRGTARARRVPASRSTGVPGGARSGGAVAGGAVPMAALLEAHGDSARVLTLRSPQDSVPVSRWVHVVGVAGDQARVVGVARGTLVVARGAAFVTPGAVVRVQGGRPAAEGLRP
jgi:RND family efflux transporter MFP subunit